MAAQLVPGPETPSRELEIELEPGPEAPAVARAALTGFGQAGGLTKTALATAVLLVSEIVTNAVIHPKVSPPATVRLRARLQGGRIRVEVADQGSGFRPEPRDPARVDGGYGLFLLDQEASDWGVSCEEWTTVWFELHAG